MKIKGIVLYPDEPLKRKAAPIEVFDKELVRFAADMLDAMERHDGVGLAAPQVGVSKRLLVLREPETGESMCLVNPELVQTEGREMGEEGCLSLPQIFAVVPRAAFIRVRAKNEFGKPREFEATGLLARIIQHEIDHLDGVLFVDRLDVVTREATLQEWMEARAALLSETPSEARAAQ